MKASWSESDREAFADGVRLRAVTVPAGRDDGPDVGDWDDDDLMDATFPIVAEPVVRPPVLTTTIGDLFADLLESAA